MKNNQDVDQLLKEQIRNVLFEETKDLSMSLASKSEVVAAISKTSLLTKIRNRIIVFLEYEIPVPFQLITVSLVIAIAAGYFLFVPPMRVSAEDVQSAKIHVEDSKGGIAYEDSEN